MSNGVVRAALLGCCGCCDGALNENSLTGSAQAAWRCQETTRLQTAFASVTARDAKQEEKQLLAEPGLEGCSPWVLSLGSSLSGYKGWLWTFFTSSLGWCIGFWISSLCWEGIHLSKQGHGKVVNCLHGLSSFIAVCKQCHMREEVRRGQRAGWAHFLD